MDWDLPAAAALHSMDSSSISVLLVRKQPGDGSSEEDVIELLKSEAYEVTEADTDAKALELLKSTRVDLILTDHEPPSWDCCKFIRSVLENPKTQLVPIVVMSSQGDKHVMAEVLHVGAADFLLKPLRRNELRTIWTHVWRRWVGMQLSNAAQGQAVLPNALVGRVPLSRGSGDSGASGEKADSSGASAPDSLNEHALAADSGPMPVHQRTGRQAGDHSCAFVADQSNLVELDSDDHPGLSASAKRKASAFAAYGAASKNLRRSHGSVTDMDAPAVRPAPAGVWPHRPTPVVSAPPLWPHPHASTSQPAGASATASAPQLQLPGHLQRPGLAQHLSLMVSRSQPQLHGAAGMLLPPLPPPLPPPIPSMALPPFGFASLAGGYPPFFPGVYQQPQAGDAQPNPHLVDPQAAAALLASLPFPCMPPVVSSVAAAMAAVQAAVAAAADRTGAVQELQRPPSGSPVDVLPRLQVPSHAGLFLGARDCLEPSVSGAGWQAAATALAVGSGSVVGASSGWGSAAVTSQCAAGPCDAPGAAGLAIATAVGAATTSKEQRAEALSRFREKRANRTFTKKIRYQSRKQLAESRPRVRGQFVRIPHGSQNGATAVVPGPRNPEGTDGGAGEEDDEEDQAQPSSS